MVTGGLLPVMYEVTGKRSRIVEYSGGVQMCRDYFDNLNPLQIIVGLNRFPDSMLEFCVSSVVGDVFISGVISGGNYVCCYNVTPLDQ
jgi:hypothetical protein